MKYWIIVVACFFSVNAFGQLKLKNLLGKGNASLVLVEKVDSHSELASIYEQEKTPLIIINNSVYRTPKTCLCDRNAGGDANGRKGGSDGKGRNNGADTDGRDAGGDGEGRSMGGDTDGRNAGGDANGRNKGGDADGRNAGGDSDNRNAGGDGEGRSMGGDTDGRNAGADGKGRKSGADGKGRNSGSDGKGRNAGSDKNGRDGGSDGKGRNGGGDKSQLQCTKTKECILQLINVREGITVHFYDAFGLREFEGGEIELN